MSKNPKLLSRNDLAVMLLTYEYPFGHGEQFVAREIHCLCEEGHRVIVVPIRYWLINRRPEKYLQKLSPQVAVELPNRMAWRWARAVPTMFSLMYRNIVISGLPQTSLRMTFKEILKAALAVGAIRQVKTKFGDAKCDVVFYSYWKTEAAAALAFMKANNELQQCVSRAHGSDILPQALDGIVSAWIGRIIVVSEHGKRLLVERGFDPLRVTVARLGVQQSRNRSRPSLDGKIRVVSCSSLIPLKRVGLIVKGLAALDRPFTWNHFGDGPERASLEAEIQAHNLQSSVRLHGHMENAELMNWYCENEADVFVNVSIREGVPVSVMEALAHGIPCIVTAVGGSPELVDDTCGRRLPPNPTSREIATAIEYVAQQPELRDGAWCRWNEMANAERVYEPVLKLICSQSSA